MYRKLDPDLAMEAKAMVALAFRNGPIEDLHAGKICEACNGRKDISHISDDEMKAIMKSAVNMLYTLLWQRDCDPAAYAENMKQGQRYTLHWDDPELRPPSRKGSPPARQIP